MNRRSFTRLLISIALLLIMTGVAEASFTDTAISWDLFFAPDGYTIPYTFNGQPVSDQESSSDGTNGGTAVSPSSIDLASGSPNGSDPGPYDTPSYGYYDGGTPYDPNDPVTLEDDYVRFSMRLVGDPRSGTTTNKTDFASYHWNVLLDVDGDGYKEFWIDLNGSYASGTNKYDQLQILYDNANDQVITDPSAARVDEFRAYNVTDSGNYSHTRVRAAGDGTGDWFIDIQVPMTAFTDLNGNQVLFPDSPVGFVFSTGASNQNPLQKDFMTDLNFLSENDPIDFGDIVKSNGEPDLFFTDSTLTRVYNYVVGDDIYLYLRDVFGNTNTMAIDTITVTVSSPASGDDEIITLTESGPNTGIFSNRGGASQPVSSDPSSSWVPFVTTSIVAAGEDWTLTYNSGTGDWSGVGSISGLQAARATAGTIYSSDDGSITFTVYENGTPANGTTIMFTSYAGEGLTTSGTAGSDDDGNLTVISGQMVYYSYSNNMGTFTDSATIVGPGEPFITFTRINGIPTGNFDLLTDPAISDKMYITIYHADSNTDPATAQTLTVTISGRDNETLTLTEAGPDTGIFRNTSTGLSTQVSDGTETPGDSLWEDVDGGLVTATFTYGVTDFTASAHLIHVIGSGRVMFTNGAGTQNIALYSSGDPVFVKLEDDTYTCGGNVTAIINSTVGDSEAITLYETFTGSAVYMNRKSDLVTTSGSAIVQSSSSTFLADGVQSGDTLVIASGPDIGTYTVFSVDSETQLTLNSSLSTSRTGIAFTTSPLVAATYDGSFSYNDGTLESSHGNTITVYYDDCDDGDLEPNNNVKTDSAAYNAPPIVINEVMFYPQTQTYPGTGADYVEYEYIQLYNSSSSAINITGYSVTDTDGFSYTIPQFTGEPGDPLNGTDITLQPGEKIYIVLIEIDGTGQSTPAHDYDSTNGIYYVYTLVDSSSGAPNEFNDPGTIDPGDQITLYDATSNAVDYVAWSTTSANTSDFLGDDADAVTAAIWQDNSYTDVTAITQGQSITRSTSGVDTDKPSDWAFTTSTVNEDFIITRVVLSSFDIEEDGRDVTVKWETASEVGTAGFELLRFSQVTNRYERVNRMLLPAAPGSMQGASYHIADHKAEPGERLDYRLVEIEHSGARRVYGPFTNDTEATTPESSVKALEGTAITTIAPSLDSDVYIITLEDNTILVTDDPLGAKRATRFHNRKSTARATVLPGASQSVAKTSTLAANESDVTYTVIRKQPRRVLGKAHGNIPAEQAGTAVKIAVATSGIHHVSAAEIAPALGMSAEDAGYLIKSGKLSLTNRGRKVAYLLSGARGFYFYGQEPNSIYTRENIYYLTRGKGTMIQLASSAARPGGAEENKTFTRSAHIEQDTFPATALAEGPNDDYWFWDYISAGFPGMDSRSYTIESPAASGAASEAMLGVELKGATSIEGVTDHHAIVSVNGTVIGEAHWSGTATYKESFIFPQTLLVDGNNTITVTGALDANIPYSVFYIDSFDLAYQSYYRAQDGQLKFVGDGNSTVTVSGFSGNSVLVFDVSEPSAPILIRTSNLKSEGGGLSISLAPRSAETPYIALAPFSALRPSAIWADSSSNLADPANQADYIIITTQALSDSVQALAKHRTIQGHIVLITTVEDIMDEFGSGLESPETIRTFLRYAYKYWAHAPKYVLLVGGGSYDYRDNLGLGGEQVPTLMAATIEGLFPSDVSLTDFNNDGLPEMAIGRFPAETAEEAQAMTDKTLSYEAAYGMSWKRRALFMADKADGTAAFSEQSEEIATLMPEKYDITRSYLDELDIASARQTALDALAEGVSFTNYSGHGGFAQLSNDGLLTLNDVPALTGTGVSTILTAMTCIAGNFGLPGYESLATALLKAPSGGAVAVLAPSGLSVSGKAQILARMFYTQAMSRAGITMGEAFTEAVNAFAHRTRSMDMLKVYNLLGDPALVIQ